MYLVNNPSKLRDDYDLTTVKSIFRFARVLQKFKYNPVSLCLCVHRKCYNPAVLVVTNKRKSYKFKVLLYKYLRICFETSRSTCRVL